MKKILIYNSGGGIGDSIQLIPFILGVKNHYKSSEVFYLGSHQNHFDNKLKEFKIKIKSLDLDLKYFGFRWWHFFIIKKKLKSLGLSRFDLIIDLQSKIRNTLILKKIPHVRFFSSTFRYKFCSTKKKYLKANRFLNLNEFLDTVIHHIDFSLDNLPENYLIEANKLLPNKNYVGFSVTQGNIYRKKSWSKDKIVLLANRIKAKNKIPVFFIEKNNTKLILEIKSKVPNALFPEYNSKLASPALVTALASRLEVAVSIDNGVMHMIGLANIPMIILFGPTNSKKFSPKIDSLKVLDSKLIYNSSDINKITVEDVFELI